MEDIQKNYSKSVLRWIKQANKYGVSINSIRMINNLNSDILTIGQTLIIP